MTSYVEMSLWVAFIQPFNSLSTLFSQYKVAYVPYKALDFVCTKFHLNRLSTFCVKVRQIELLSPLYNFKISKVNLILLSM